MPRWKVKGRSKYGNKKVELDGYKFDSIKEKNRYVELMLMQKVGEISALEVHLSFDLPVNSVLIAKYVSDFTYYREGNYCVEDAKGFKTPVYRLKKKLMKAIYRIEILET